MSDPLQEFIEGTKAHGASDQTLIALLKRQGWSERQVFGAIQTYYEEKTGLRLPLHPSSWETAKDAFVYLLSFIALCSWAWSMGSLWFTLIELALPDPLEPAYARTIRYSLASSLSGLIVGLPVYLVCLRTIARELAGNPDKLDSGIRKWLTYMAMLIAAGVILGDLITFLNHFLRGELTLRFLSKATTVLALAGGVLWYHLGSMRPVSEAALLAGRDRIYAMTLVAAGLLSLGAGLYRLGTPADSRSFEADSQRSDDLRRIALEIHTGWTSRKTLPATLAEIADRARPSDPVTKRPYQYAITGTSTYNLCADFQTNNLTEPETSVPTKFARHPSGRYCFAVDASVWPR